jgi:methylene-fatty-acyl-phospholipid synthase
VTAWVFLAAALLLSLERICYVVVLRAPAVFLALSSSPLLVRIGEPVVVLRVLFYVFKALQFGVFIGWCAIFGHGTLWPPDAAPPWTLLAIALITAGQALNVSVFYRLGVVGVFYGSSFGHDVPRCVKFPFSVLDHPQYAGTLLSIWGIFLLVRFPHPDWLLLPVLETIYYVLGAHLETEAGAHSMLPR